MNHVFCKTPRPSALCLWMSFLLIFGLILENPVFAQDPNFQPIIGQIGALESVRDPKCHATASRLEDFLYGTPLCFEARNKRIEFQQSFVEIIWLDFTAAKKNKLEEQSDLALFETIESKHFTFREDESGVTLQFDKGKQINITNRDFRQYSSVAYALRAILAVQQIYLFKTEKLARLDDGVLERFKKSLDLAVLALLNEADQLARKDDKHQIEEKHLESAINNLFPRINGTIPVSNPTSAAVDQSAFVYEIINQKLASYQKYNQITQAVFLRNVQVYFSKVPWPGDKEESIALKNFFTEAMAQFSISLLDYTQQNVLAQNKATIHYEDIYKTVQAFLPHEVNMFEDVIYFPNLERKGQLTIEAYDLDAFRDSGLHWQYLKFALDDPAFQLKTTLDPFAMEMAVEGIAQFAVLVFRMAGMDAMEKEQSLLKIQNINTALMQIQEKLNNYGNSAPKESDLKIVSGKSQTETTEGNLFTEVNEEWEFSFEHRNSDWLNRLIRSYVIKEDENLARLSIPPAFGGGGVAAEDFDNDGWVDLLLLSGRGNHLLKNEKGEKLVNVTKEAGLDWKRNDGSYGEPRQPIIVDFDNDGWQDIFISYVNDAHRIYRNRGDGTFEDMTQNANLGGIGLVGGPCTSIDYDKDGLLDLYIGYFGNYLKGELPTLKRHNTNGSPNMLFRNKGNFQFENVSNGSGLENSGWTQAVGHADINGDGWQDLIVGNDFGTNSYYLNNQNGTFSDFSEQLGTNKPSYTMNVGISDLNRDQLPDFYISNIVVMEKDDKYVLPNEDTQAHFDPSSLSTMRVVEANDLFISSFDEKGELSYTQSTAIGRGYASTGWSWDADFFDFDNDSDDDLYCLTGMNQYSVYGTENPYYNSPEGEAVDITVAKSSKEPNILFNNSNGQLEVVDKSSGLDYSGTSRSGAYFDMDNDGDLDLVVNEYQGSAKLFRNNAEKSENNWVKIKLIGDPAKKMSKDAIGAAVILTLPDGTKQWKEVYSTTGYLSGHPKDLHFGLGDSKQFELEVKWTDGSIQRHKNLQINSIHLVRVGEK